MTPSAATLRSHARQRAFSLVELVIVVVILGIIAAIAMPRVGKAGSGAQATALRATLANVRKAIDMYAAEHGKYPGYDPSDGSPSGDDFIDQLTLYSDRGGKTNATPTATYAYGPYLRKPFPTNPFNGLSTVHVKATPPGLVTLNSTGWVAVLSTGAFGINVAVTDLNDAGVADATEVTRMRGGGAFDGD